MRRLLSTVALLASLSSMAAPFTITITNTSPTADYDWSAGLLTLQPLISIGLTPRPGNPAYATYVYANSDCNLSDTFCSGSCNDNGNATVLANRWGLTLGTNAWLVPAVPANGGSTTVTIDAPAGARLSYIAWVNSTSVFDDFVAMHDPTDKTVLSVPLYDTGGAPLANVDFVISGYDVNSTSPTDGSGATCAQACPVPATGCYVAVGNASAGAQGNFPAPTPPSIRNLTATSGVSQNRLEWSSNAPQSGVVVVRRTGSAVTFTPTNGTTYSVNQNLGSGQTVVATTTGANGFTDTGLVNGTRYFYKVFSRRGTTYAGGNIPSSNGLFSDPTTKTGTSPLWCYSVGFPSLQQPTTELGSAVFTASNGGALTASRTTVGTPATDGFERWRPTQLTGAVQSRPALVPLQGRSGNWLLSSDQTGRAYAVSAATGEIAWQTGVLATTIQAQPVVQLFQYANAAFQAAQPGRDLVFVGSRISGNSNRVVALSSVDGNTVWTHAPNNGLEMVSGGMAVDYTNNRLWVAARGGAASRPGMRVLNSLTGAQVASFNSGNFEFGVNLRFQGGQATQAVAVTNVGVVYGYTLATMTQAWTFNLGSATTAYVVPLADGYLAPMANGTVRRYAQSGTTSTLLWTATVPGPSGLTVDYTNQKIFVGSSDGTLKQLNLATGAIERSVTVTTAGAGSVGMPTFDATASRVHVGLLDGRLCAYPSPLP